MRDPRPVSNRWRIEAGLPSDDEVLRRIHREERDQALNVARTEAFRLGWARVRKVWWPIGRFLWFERQGSILIEFEELPGGMRIPVSGRE